MSAADIAKKVGCSCPWSIIKSSMRKAGKRGPGRLEQTLGRVAEPPPGEPLDIAPPKLRTAAECSAALQKVAEPLCEGRVDAAIGKVLVDVIRTQAKLLEVTDLEARLAELEKASATVDLPGSHMRF